MTPLRLSKDDAKRAWVSYQFKQGSAEEVFLRLGSVQFDPLSPAGSNHDLVLQARVPGYQIGNWEKLAYQDRFIYDGWDKQACLIPFSGWSARRVIREHHAEWFANVFKDYGPAIELVRQELTERGPLIPKEFVFQEHKAEWKGSWFGPSLTKRILKALWHTGQVMTHSRRGTNHVYDLTERIVPPQFLGPRELSTEAAMREVILDRHRAVGFLRPAAPGEIWAIPTNLRRNAIKELQSSGQLLPLEIEGLTLNASPEFLASLDDVRSLERAVIVAPLDQILWDRKVVEHVFGFDYIWEVYKPVGQRKWGYYVLPILFGDRFVARMEVWARKGELEIREWHWEAGEPSTPDFLPAFGTALKQFMHYSRTTSLTTGPNVSAKSARIIKRALKEAPSAL